MGEEDVVLHWPAPPTEAVALPAPGPRAAWGFWSTTGWLLLAWIIALVVQVAGGIVAAALYFATHGAASSPTGLEAYIDEHYGLLTAVVGTLSMAIGVAFLLVPIALRRRGWREYLALGGVPTWQVVIATAIVFVVIAIESFFATLLDRPIPQDMIDLRRTAGVLPLLWFFVVAVAPVAEEVFFRGFAYRGWADSRIGPVGAILLGTLLWTLLHVQYELYELSWVFLLGLVLGTTRWATGSTSLCILMHAMFNLLATVLMEVEWVTM